MFVFFSDFSIHIYTTECSISFNYVFFLFLHNNFRIQKKMVLFFGCCCRFKLCHLPQACPFCYLYKITQHSRCMRIQIQNETGKYMMPLYFILQPSSFFPISMFTRETHSSFTHFFFFFGCRPLVFPIFSSLSRHFFSMPTKILLFWFKIKILSLESYNIYISQIHIVIPISFFCRFTHKLWIASSLFCFCCFGYDPFPIFNFISNMIFLSPAQTFHFTYFFVCLFQYIIDFILFIFFSILFSIITIFFILFKMKKKSIFIVFSLILVDIVFKYCYN